MRDRRKRERRGKPEYDNLLKAQRESAGVSITRKKAKIRTLSLVRAESHRCRIYKASYVFISTK